MSIVLDPTKSVVTIEIYYVEEKKDHGNTFFHFINSKEEFEDWRGKGYQTKAEILEEIKKAQTIEEESKSNQGYRRKIEPEKLLEVGDYKIIEKLVTHWRQLSWKDNNTILSKSMREVRTKDGYTSELDPLLYRDLKLKTALKAWDAKDERGNEIPVNDTVIDNMIPEVAAALLINYEKVCEQPSEQFKKEVEDTNGDDGIETEEDKNE